MNTEIIAFFSAAGVFRKKTAETQRKAFDDCAEDFAVEFERDMSESDWQLCLNYMADKAEAKRKREKARLDREAAKAAKLAAMPVAAGADTATDHVQTLEPGIYVLTAAQNNTYVNSDFLASLEVFCEVEGAKMLIAKALYNKNAFRQPGIDESEDLWFDEKVKPYLVEGHFNLGGLDFLADANIIPTAKHPTSGFDGAGAGDIVVPATKIELRCTPALKGAKVNRIASTGAVTKRNYILRKAGAVAAINHNIGALVVDTRGKTPSIIHVEQMEGFSGFYYGASLFTPQGEENALGKVAAIQLGDLHCEKMDQNNWNDAIDLIQALEPSNIILHDVLDFTSRNHHNINDPLHMFKHREGTVEDDIKDLTWHLNNLTARAATYSNIYIIESNHDLALERWLKESDFKDDPINALFYLRCMTAYYEALEQGDNFNVLEFACREIVGLDNDVNFHTTDESLVIAGVEMGNHGHNGPNGSRGNPKTFGKLGVPMNTGHTHSPSIYGNCYTAGVTGSLNMGYNVGPSSWAVAHVVTYENGQRAIIFT